VGSGETVNVGVQNEREWERFCAVVLRRPELVDDPRFAGNASRVAHRGALDAQVAAVFSGLDLAEARRRLETAGIAYAQQRDLAGFAGHPQLAARGRWREVATEGGPVRALLPPVSAAWDSPMGPVPAAGEHTAQVLAWLDDPAGAPGGPPSAAPGHGPLG
jgi:itaconate CoA-transferase